MKLSCKKSQREKFETSQEKIGRARARVKPVKPEHHASLVLSALDLCPGELVGRADIQTETVFKLAAFYVVKARMWFRLGAKRETEGMKSPREGPYRESVSCGTSAPGEQRGSFPKESWLGPAFVGHSLFCNNMQKLNHASQTAFAWWQADRESHIGRLSLLFQLFTSTVLR